MIAETVIISNLVAATAPLFAEFMKTRGERAEAATQQEFQKWLEQAVPQLITNSEKIFASLISLKANNAEQYQTIIGLLLKIEESISPKSKDRFLSDLDWRVLTAIATSFGGNPIDEAQLAGTLELTNAELKKSVKLLSELGYAKVISSTKHSAAEATAKGYLKHQVRESLETANALVIAVLQILPSSGGYVRFRDLASKAQVPKQFLKALITVWSERNLLNFEDNSGTLDFATIEDVTQMLLHDEANRDLIRLLQN